MAGDRGDEIEIAAVMQHGETLEFGDRRDQEVGDGDGSMLASGHELGLGLSRAFLSANRHDHGDQRAQHVLPRPVVVPLRAG